MPNNFNLEQERISTRIAEEIKTPIGTVFVTYSQVNNEVVMSFHNAQPERIRFETAVSDGSPELHVRIGKRPPRIGDEVTQNGKTFEVSGVRMAGGGRFQLRDDLGVWVDWKED